MLRQHGKTFMNILTVSEVCFHNNQKAPGGASTEGASHRRIVGKIQGVGSEAKEQDSLGI